MFHRTKRDANGFQIITEPLGHAGWWFWGAMGVSIGIWCGIIYGACSVL